MKAFWFGTSPNPLTGATTHAPLTATPPVSTSTLWLGGEANLNALSEAAVVKRLTVWVTNAPGTSKSWTFTLRNNLANTAAAVTISGSDTSASWTGSVSLAALSVVGLLCVPSGTPTAAGSVHWTIEYETDGDFYMVLGGSPGNGSTSATGYQNAFGTDSYTPPATELGVSCIAADTLTVTKVVARSNVALTGQYGVYVRRNHSTDSTGFALLEAAHQVAVSPSFSLSFAVYEFLSIKIMPIGAPSAVAVFTCMTVVPGRAGDVLVGVSAGALADNIARYFAPEGQGAPNTIEANVRMRVPACTIDQMAVRMATAPGAGKSRTFTVRDAGADTALAIVIPDTYNAANPKTDVAHAQGDFLSVGVVGANTPALTNCKVTLLLHVDQGTIVKTTDFFF